MRSSLDEKPQTAAVFVQNRLKEIKSHKDIKFRYVTTTQNPADLATRGVSAEALIDINCGGMDPEADPGEGLRGLQPPL